MTAGVPVLTVRLYREQMHQTLCSACAVPGRDIRLVMEGKPRNLIETVATDIATNILQDYREVRGLKISVQKPHVALDGVVKSMGGPPSR